MLQQAALTAQIRCITVDSFTSAFTGYMELNRVELKISIQT